MSSRRLTVVARAGLAQTDAFVAAVGDRLDLEIVITESVDEVGAAVGSASDAGAGAIAAVGGDGSINAVADAIVGGRADVALVPVPAGTVNLATQVLGIDSVATAAESAVARSSRVIDVGETGEGVFVLNASTGYDAAVIDDAADHSDAKFGRVRFITAGIRRLRRDQPIPVRVTVDGRNVFDARAMSVIVMNVGRRVSDTFEVSPDASFDDGLLDVLIVRADTASRFLALVWRVARRAGVPNRDAVRAQGEVVKVQWARPVPSQRDGDADGRVRSVTARCRPAALTIHHG